MREVATHVKQFHLVNLNIVQPPFRRLHNLFRLWDLKEARMGATRARARRPTFKPKHIAAICTLCKVKSGDKSLPLDDRVSWAVLRCIVSGGFQLLYRVGELAVGAAYDPAGTTHFSVRWLQPLLQLELGQNALIMHSQRKVENEWTKEMFPVLYTQHVSNFVSAYKALRLLDPSPPETHCAFRLDSTGTSPTAGWVCESLKSLMKQLFPLAAHGMDYTDHCLRRGGETALVAMEVDPKIQEQIGCWSRDSVSRHLYMARVRQVLVGIQSRMLSMDYNIMQDDYEFVDQGPRGPRSLETINAHISSNLEQPCSEARQATEQQAHTVPAPPAKQEPTLTMEQQRRMTVRATCEPPAPEPQHAAQQQVVIATEVNDYVLPNMDVTMTDAESDGSVEEALQDLTDLLFDHHIAESELQDVSTHENAIEAVQQAVEAKQFHPTARGHQDALTTKVVRIPSYNPVTHTRKGTLRKRKAGAGRKRAGHSVHIVVPKENALTKWLTRLT